MTVLKTYQVEDKFISGIAIENYTIDVNLIQVAEDGTVTASTDKIKNRNAGNDEITAITTTRTDIKETEVQISLKKKSSASKIKMITSTIVLLDEPRTINLPVKGEVVRYYVYNKGKVIPSTDSISEAIITANANSAIVVTVSNSDFGDEIFSGMNFQEKLEEKAYLLGNGNIPCQYFKDYKNLETSWNY